MSLLVDWHIICFVCLFLLCPAGSCWFVPSGRYMLLSQCCPMERVVNSGTQSQAESTQFMLFFGLVCSILPLCAPYHCHERASCVQLVVKVNACNSFCTVILSWRCRDKGFPQWWLWTSSLPWKVLRWVTMARYLWWEAKITQINSLKKKIPAWLQGLLKETVWLSRFSSSDCLVCAVPLSDQCIGEAEERQRARELHSSNPSVALPWQRAEELHPCYS